MVQSMVACGRTSNLAIEKVYAVYGRGQAPGIVCNRMQEDWKLWGGHPKLRASGQAPTAAVAPLAAAAAVADT